MVQERRGGLMRACRSRVAGLTHTGLTGPWAGVSHSDAMDGRE